MFKDLVREVDRVRQGNLSFSDFLSKYRDKEIKLSILSLASEWELTTKQGEENV